MWRKEEGKKWKKEKNGGKRRKKEGKRGIKATRSAETLVGPILRRGASNFRVLTKEENGNAVGRLAVNDTRQKRVKNPNGKFLLARKLRNFLSVKMRRRKRRKKRGKKRKRGKGGKKKKEEEKEKKKEEKASQKKKLLRPT